MYILSLDSTAIAATVALCDDQKLLSLTTVENGNTHSQTLLPMVEETLARFELRPTDVELYACSAGPGSFTGVRIGASTIKGLAFGTSISCIGVSTLEALAQNLVGFDGILCPVMNARRNQVYNALFECKDGVITRLCEDRAIALDALDEELSAMGDKPVYLVGDGYDLSLSQLKKCADHIRPTPVLLRTQNAYSVAQVALVLYESGVRTNDQELVPVYLRPCQAERERLERLEKEASNPV
ncbi:MAG: tRNA (adenosine(37)-N6)-threonylcarbamoyltransferase complex dimerization subunit type 1 TsaB [Clostridia bacterium]|nr:tRNA (adenosine(37)-N6)-threonylcarbamoyltransferase complex dimerization subunit type 1 TsaB [Clostridia bacterium]